MRRHVGSDNFKGRYGVSVSSVGSQILMLIAGQTVIVIFTRTVAVRRMDKKYDQLDHKAGTKRSRSISSANNEGGDGVPSIG